METGTYTTQHQVTIYYEDTDFSGFVYHANYLRFFERAREHSLGIAYLRQLYQDGTHFVVAEANMQFKAPARHGDELEVRSTMTYGRGSTILFHQEAWRVAPMSSGVLVCAADIRLATLNSDNRPIRLPAHVFDHFSDRSASAFEKSLEKIDGTLRSLERQDPPHGK